MKKKKGLSFHYITLMVFCQVFGGLVGILGVRMASATEGGITSEQAETISTHCETIRDNLRRVQREDSVVRTHLGPYYNTVLEKFVKPLNLRLVENSLAESGLMENQSNFATSQEIFRSDYNVYQRALEDLILIDCKTEPARFYDQLILVRAKRKTVAQDVLKMRSLVSEQIGMVNKLKGEL